MSGQDQEARERAELEQLLAQGQAPLARPAFRGELRERFIAGELEALTGEDVGLEPEPALVALLERSAPQADPAFKRGLRDAFLEGALPPVLPSPPRSARSMSWRFRLIGAALATAAGLLLWTTLVRPTPSPWRVQPAGFVAAEVTVDAQSLAGLSAQEVGRRLVGARHLATGNAPLRVEWGRVLLLELGPNSAVELSGLELSRTDLALASERGSLRLATGPDFPGRQLELRTPDVEVAVVGTVFGIDIEAYGTCVCCAEGEVLTRSLHDRAVSGTVGGEAMGFVFSDGRAAQFGQGMPHAPALEPLRGYW